MNELIIDIIGLSDYLRVTEIKMSTALMSPVTLNITGTPTNSDNRISLLSEYDCVIQLNGKTHYSIVTITNQSSNSVGGIYTITGILGPKELIKGKANRYFTSIRDAVITTGGNIEVPSRLSSREEYYNQQGELNYRFLLDTALRSTDYQIPALDLTGLVLVDFTGGGAPRTLDSGRITVTKGSSSKLPSEVDSQVDSFEVAVNKSDIELGTVGVKANRDIINSYYKTSYEILSINKQLLEDTVKSIEIKYTGDDYVNIGSTVYFDGDIYVVIAVDLIINHGHIINYKLMKAYEVKVYYS